jgi:hypothetical protein
MKDKIPIKLAYDVFSRKHKNGAFSGGWSCKLCARFDRSNHVGNDESEEKHFVERTALAHVMTEHADEIEMPNKTRHGNPYQPPCSDDLP